MLLVFIIICGVIFAIGSIIAYKKILNPIFIILTWYIVGAVISHSGILGMYKPSSGSTEFILINILVLCFSFFIISSIKTYKTFRILNGFSAKKVEKVFSIMRISSFFTQSIIALNLILLIIKGRIDISSIRLIVYSLAYDSDKYTMIFFNAFIYNIFNFFIKGFILFDASLSLCEFVTEDKKIRKISLINLLLYCFIILSRIEILRIIIIFSLIMIFNNYFNINKKSRKGSYKSIIIFFIIAMIITFSFRTSSGESVILTSINELIISLTGSYVVFGNFFTSYLNGLRLIDSNIFKILIGGLEPVFYSLFKIIGIIIELPTSTLNEYISPGTNIGASDHYNAFYTMYYNFLSGGGFTGVLIATIILGIVLAMLYKSCIRLKNSQALLIFVFLLHIIILGSIRWELSTFSIWVMFILTILNYIKRKT